MSQLTDRANFGIIRYANCWEDADVLLQALRPKQGEVLLSIASAGDNSFSLLTANPELVVAVDLSEPQLYLVELKKAAMQQMAREEFLAFIGLSTSKNRLKGFELLKNNISSEARAYWESQREVVANGLAFQGKFERYFQFFKKWLMPLVHSKKNIHRLFEEKGEKTHYQFYHSTWNSYRWRLLFRIFFSKKVLGKYGRDPEFLNEVKVPVSEYIFQKAEKHLTKTQSQQNYFLRMIMLGEFGNTLPHYLRAGHYESAKANLGQLKTHLGYAEDALKTMPPVNGCNLSNIFEYMPPDVFKNTAESLAKHTPVGCRVAYWNLMVPRRLSGILPDRFTFDRNLSNQLTEEDLGFFYNSINLDTRI